MSADQNIWAGWTFNVCGNVDKAAVRVSMKTHPVVAVKPRRRFNWRVVCLVFAIVFFCATFSQAEDRKQSWSKNLELNAAYLEIQELAKQVEQLKEANANLEKRIAELEQKQVKVNEPTKRPPIAQWVVKKYTQGKCAPGDAQKKDMLEVLPPRGWKFGENELIYIIEDDNSEGCPINLFYINGVLVEEIFGKIDASEASHKLLKYYKQGEKERQSK